MPALHQSESSVNRLTLEKSAIESLSKANRTFPSCLKPLFQDEAKCEAICMKTIFILIQIKLIFARRVLHIASFSR